MVGGQAWALSQAGSSGLLRLRREADGTRA